MSKKKKSAPEEIIYNKTTQSVIHANLPKMIGEYPHLVEDLYKYKNEPNCGCRGTVYAEFKKDPDKFNKLMSELMGKDVEIYFPGTLLEPVYEEYNSPKEAYESLKQFVKRGTQVRSFSLTDLGDGKVAMICL